jgi:L-arabinonolactonase
MRVTRVNTCRCRGGENPLWDGAGQSLFFIDNFGGKVHRFDPRTEATRTWQLPGVITTLALRAQGGAIVTLRTGIHLLDFDSGALELLVPLAEPPPIVFNDGTVDRRGRFIVGASTANFASPAPDGGLYSLDGGAVLKTLDSGIYFSNGPCFSPDGTRLYFADSFHHVIYVYDYDLGSGEVAGRRTFAETRELGGMPDGASMDCDGLLWSAMYGGGKVVAFRPDGRIERVVELPVRLTSSVAFGGSDLERLYVTTIEEGALGEPREEGAGDLFVIEGLGARGLPEPRYAG